MTTLKHPVIIVALVILGLFISYRIGHAGKPTVAYVDLKQVIAVPMKMAATQLPKAKQADFAKRYSAALASTLQAYGKRHHLTLIAASVLTRNSVLNVTPDIIQANVKRMGGLSNAS